jgi:hypothetical protein
MPHRTQQQLRRLPVWTAPARSRHWLHPCGAIRTGQWAATASDKARAAIEFRLCRACLYYYYHGTANLGGALARFPAAAGGHRYMEKCSFLPCYGFNWMCFLCAFTYVLLLVTHLCMIMTLLSPRFSCALESGVRSPLTRPWFGKSIARLVMTL